jgi:surface antigen
MAIDYSFLNAIPGAILKQRAKALDKADKQKAIEAKDRAENAKAKKRAGGRCEVVEAVVTANARIPRRIT